MSKKTMVVLAACLLAIGMARSALCEDLVGTVVDQDGQAVPGATILTQTPNGQTVATATSDAQGQYQISGLNAGEYFITLTPGLAAAQGETVASYVGGSGLTVDWSVKPGTEPVASAQSGVRSEGASSEISKLSFNSDLDPPGRGCFYKSTKKYCDNGYACDVFPYGCYYYCSCCRIDRFD